MSDNTDKSPAQEVAEQATDAANEGGTTSQATSQPEGGGQGRQGSGAAEDPTTEAAADGVLATDSDTDSAHESTEADEGAPGPAEELDPGEKDNLANNAAVE